MEKISQSYVKKFLKSEGSEAKTKAEKEFQTTREFKAVKKVLKEVLEANPTYSKYKLLSEIANTANQYYVPLKTTKKKIKKGALERVVAKYKAKEQKEILAAIEENYRVTYEMATEDNEYMQQTCYKMYFELEDAFFEMVADCHEGMYRAEIYNLKTKRAHIYVACFEEDSEVKKWKHLEIRQY